jgi:hypothetical protein
VDERILSMLEQHEAVLEELQALLEGLHAEGKLRHFDSGDFRALRAVWEALNLEVRAHREDA